MRVPAVYAHQMNISCLAYESQVTANCLDLHGPSGDADATTYTARYFPAYYAALGLAARPFPPGAPQVYVMRVLNALAVAALLASCATTLVALGSALASIGAFAALTPMVLFLAGVVNGSGIEIAAGIAVWVHGGVLATRPPGDDDPALLRRLLVAIGVLCLTRPLSPGWAVLALLLLGGLAGRNRVAALARMRSARPWALFAGFCFLAQLVWVVWQRPFDYQIGEPAEQTGLAIVRIGIGHGSELVRQMIGVFGWLDAPAPYASILVVLLAVGALLGLSFVLGSPRALVVVGLAVFATWLIPIVLESAKASDNGFIWQGRYTLPLAVAIPILAGIVCRFDLALTRSANRAAAIIAAGLIAGQALAFGEALRRYAVGTPGAIWFFTGARWNPPVPSLLLVVVYVAALAGVVVWCRPRPVPVRS